MAERAGGPATRTNSGWESQRARRAERVVNPLFVLMILGAAMLAAGIWWQFGIGWALIVMGTVWLALAVAAAALEQRSRPL